MSADKSYGKGDKDDLKEEIKRLEREIRLLKRTNERARPSFVPQFAMPPLPPPPPVSVTASGPMLMAWLLSWMYSSATPNATTFDSLARFAASREAFWHQSVTDFSAMADQYDAPKPGGANGAALSPEQKAKIKAALENDKLDPQLVDAVLHAINSLDAFQIYRDMAMREQKSPAG
jgi:hypothetical protein